MGKYGSGVSIRTVIAEEFKNIKNLLGKKYVSSSSKKEILNAIQEMAYQWCQANATALVMELCLLKLLPREDYIKITTAVLNGNLIEVNTLAMFPFDEKGNLVEDEIKEEDTIEENS